jgi:aryl-alcohol dehydrogenase-like predicted oxidoreductase
LDKKKIIIGTANFGCKYGFQKKYVSKDEVKKIFSFLKKNKILYIETSENYKEAIDILGSVNLDNFKIILKISLKNEEIEIFSKRINKLLKRLKTKKIYAIMVHNFPASLKKEKIKDLLKELNNFKFVKKKGISIYSVNDLKKIEKLLWKPDIIQVPANIIDKRFVDDNKINFSFLKNSEIHIRSIFLQGILLNSNSLPTYFNKWKNIFEKLRLYCIKQNIDLLSLNLNYIKNVKTKKIIIGINSLKQIEDILNYKKKNIDLNLDFNDIKLLDPRNWKT